MKKEETFLHVKVNYGESINAKKQILSSQIRLLRIIKNIKKFKELRILELDQKINISQRTKGLKEDLKNIQKILPNQEIPKKYKQKITTPNKEVKEKTIQKKEPESDLDLQLKEIQEKLRLIGA
jgi:hypothetical protein